MSDNSTGIVYMPDGKGGTKPAPFLLDEEDAILFLRLKNDSVNKNRKTLDYYRSSGKLVGRHVGKRVVYALTDLIEFVKYGTATTS